MSTSAAPRGQLTTLLLKDESAYGSAATGNYKQSLHYEDTLAEAPPRESDPILGTARANARDKSNSVEGLKQGVAGNLVVPLDLNHIWFWLKGAFGAPTSTGSDPDYSHVFVSGGEVLPHRTIEGKRKSDVFLQRTGCLVGSINGEMSRRGGFERATVGILGRKESNLASTGGGTPATMLDRDALLAVLGTIKLDDAAVADILSVSWNYSNGATPGDYLGDAEGYPVNHDLDAEATFAGTIRARFRTDALYDAARAGTPFALELLWEKTAARSLSLAAPVVYLDPVGLPVTGPGRVEMTFNFNAEQSESDPMLTATLLSGTAGTAYA